MPRMKTVTMFGRTMGKLLADRKKKLAKATKILGQVSEIDALFAQFGIAIEDQPAKAGRKAKKVGRSGGRRKRRVFAVSGEESILAFLKKHGKVSTSDINKYWKGVGRGGKADNSLTKMVQAGALKRIKTKGVRGSEYTIA
jgi:hypothetical protein